MPVDLNSTEQSPPGAEVVPVTVRLAAPSLKGVVRILLVAIACCFALYLLWRVRTVLGLSAISLFLALALVPVVDAFDRRTRLPRSVIILLVYLMLIGAVLLIAVVVVPSLVKEVNQLSRDAPRYVHDLRSYPAFRHYDDKYHLSPKLLRDATRLPHTLANLVGPLKDVTVSAFSLIGQMITCWRCVSCWFCTAAST